MRLSLTKKRCQSIEKRIEVVCPMKCTAERFSLVIRTLLLVICCTLFLPQGLQASQHKGMDSSVIRASAMTLAVTAINNPTSHLQNLANGENTALRGLS